MSDGFEHIDPLAPGRKPNGFWTRERCKQAAIGCGAIRLKEWQKKHEASYRAAMENKWNRKIAEELGWETTTPPGYWTKETCKQAAIDCGATRLKEWEKMQAASYQAACINGWNRAIAEELGWKAKVVPGYWTKERCTQAVVACGATRLFEWAQKHRASYDAATKNGWKRAIAEELEFIGNKPPEYWTKEICKQSAIDCGATGLKDWGKKHHASYEMACANGWQREIAEELGWKSHMSRGYWTKKICKQSAIDCEATRLVEWRDRHPASHTMAVRNGWQREIAEELGWETATPPGYWTKERCKQAAIDCGATRLGAWAQEHGTSYATAQRNGWHREIAEELGWEAVSPPGYWTKETCKQAAIDCGATRLVEWQKKHGATYSAAWRNLWHREIAEELGWEIQESVERGHWTKETCKQAAIDCGATRLVEWRKNHTASYQAALKYGWQREIAEELGWSIFFHDDNVMDTVIYIYTHDSYVYIGETCDPESRHVQHLNGESSSVVFTHIPDYVEPVYFERLMEYSGEYAPYVMTGWQALRWEKRMIKRAVAMGLKVLNKTHNPQWDGTRYSWEDE